MSQQLINRRTLLASAISGLVVASNAANAAAYPSIKAYRNPGCGCCEKWAGLMKEAGFAITLEDDEDLAGRKEKLGVPADLAGCHTALMEDYVIEGHVPVDDIKRLLVERPVARGLAVPGMPAGSPGMENGGPPDAFMVFLFKNDGSKTIYAAH